MDTGLLRAGATEPFPPLPLQVCATALRFLQIKTCRNIAVDIFCICAGNFEVIYKFANKDTYLIFFEQANFSSTAV